MSQGEGAGDDPKAPTAWLGEMAPAVSTITCSGAEIGFEFESRDGTSTDGGYAQIGHERNGLYLT